MFRTILQRAWVPDQRIVGIVRANTIHSVPACRHRLLPVVHHGKLRLMAKLHADLARTATIILMSVLTVR